jgi:hypothetical protein
MAVMGMAPFGALLAGTLAARTSPAVTVRLAGIVCVLAAGSFAFALPRLRPLVRSIYLRRGIILPTAPMPEPAVSVVRDPRPPGA